MKLFTSTRENSSAEANVKKGGKTTAGDGNGFWEFSLLGSYNNRCPDCDVGYREFRRWSDSRRSDYPHHRADACRDHLAHWAWLPLRASQARSNSSRQLYRGTVAHVTHLNARQNNLRMACFAELLLLPEAK